MKLNKIIFTAALACAAGFAGAQTVTLKGNVDYTNYGVIQTFSKAGDADMEHTDPVAGLSDDAETVVDLNLKAANFEFNLGVKLNESAGDEGDNDYTDYTDGYDGTPFYQGNMKIGFFNDQLNVYTGKFEDFNAGYFAEGPVFGDQNIRYFASSDMGQYYTALNFTPYVVSGLKVLVGVPILPVGGNGVQNTVGANMWKNLYKKINVAAGYTIPGTEFSVTAGWRPGTYYTGVKAYDASAVTTGDDGAFTKSAFGEAFLASELKGITEGLDLIFAADFRYRDAEYTKTDATTATAFTYAGVFSAGANISLIEALPLQAELRVMYANDDYIKADEKLLGGELGVSGQHKLAGTNWALGFTLKGKYSVDARGTSYEDGEVSDIYFDDFDLGDLNCAASVAAGKSANYISAYANPYVQYNLSNGYIRMGVEAQYSQIKNDDTSNMAISYRVPVGICFNF